MEHKKTSISEQSLLATIKECSNLAALDSGSQAWGVRWTEQELLESIKTCDECTKEALRLSIWILCREWIAFLTGRADAKIGATSKTCPYFHDDTSLNHFLKNAWQQGNDSINNTQNPRQEQAKKPRSHYKTTVSKVQMSKQFEQSYHQIQITYEDSFEVVEFAIQSLSRTIPRQEIEIKTLIMPETERTPKIIIHYRTRPETILLDNLEYLQGPLVA
jgi:hypothetical protein